VWFELRVHPAQTLALTLALHVSTSVSSLFPKSHKARNSHIFVELLAIHAMPHCPRCGRRYTTDEKVLRHLNQPRSSCVNFDTSDLVSIPLPMNTPQSQNASLEQGLDDVEMNAMDDDGDFATQNGTDIQMATDNPGSFNSATGSIPREEFPNAAHDWVLAKHLWEVSIQTILQISAKKTYTIHSHQKKIGKWQPFFYVQA